MPNPNLRLERWQSLSPGQQQAVRELRISAEQVEFAGTVDRAIQACEAASPEDVAGLAILQGDGVVGFVVLSRRAKRPDWAPPGAVALTAMRIDAGRQGQGLGRAALACAEAWLHARWPGEGTLALSVDEGNPAGRRAYAAAGFAEYGEPRQGRIGLVRYLSKRLAGADPRPDERPSVSTP